MPDYEFVADEAYERFYRFWQDTHATVSAFSDVPHVFQSRKGIEQFKSRLQ